MTQIAKLDHHPVTDRQPKQLADVKLANRNVSASAVYNPETLFDEDVPPTLAMDPTQIASKHLHGRKITHDKHLAERFCVELILAFFKKSLIPDAQDRMDRLRLKVEAGLREGEDIQELVAEEFSDISEQYMALEYLARQLEQKGGHDDALEDIYEALAELEQDQGQSIRAGIHALEALEKEMAQDRAIVEGLRSDYRALVELPTGLPAMMSLLLDRREVSELPQAVRSFSRALADDLGSGWPSRDPVHLRMLIDNLYHAEVLTTLAEQCRTQTAQLAKRHGLNLPLGRLLKDVVSLAQDRWASSSRFDSLGNSFGIREPSARVEFLGMVKRLIHEMPLKVYEDGDARLNLLTAAQEALDRAIEDEEAA